MQSCVVPPYPSSETTLQEAGQLIAHNIGPYFSIRQMVSPDGYGWRVGLNSRMPDLLRSNCRRSRRIAKGGGGLGLSL